MIGEVDASQRTAARVAGVSYLFLVFGGILYYLVVVTKLTVPGGAAATANAVLAHELLFRIGIGYEIFMAVNLIVLGMAHHTILRSVDRSLAGLGLAAVLAEAFLAAVMALAAFVAMQLLLGHGTLTALRPEELRELVGAYLDIRIAGHTVSTVFLDLGMVMFFSLFWRSGSIPRPLAGFGVVAYALILAAAAANILAPGSPTTMMTMQRPLDVVCVVPSILLEVAAGAWLVIKGIRVEPRASRPR